jgi:hypothetical protein
MVMISPLSYRLVLPAPQHGSRPKSGDLHVRSWPGGETLAVDTGNTQYGRRLQAAVQCRKLATTSRWPSCRGRTMAALMRIFGVLGYRLSAEDSGSTWIKSSLSAYNGNCVQVAGLTADTIRVRDSKHPRGAVLHFTPAEWDAFIGGVHKGEFNREPSRQ